MTLPLMFDVLARDGASSAFNTIATSTGKANKSMAALTGVAGTLGRQLGGELGEMLTRTSEGFETAAEAGQAWGARLMGVGGTALAVGVMLQRMGSQEQAATEQLKTAIEDTGNSWGDYSEEVEKAVKSGEDHAHSAVDTKAALQALTQATQDPTKALEDMNVVQDLAAAKHTTLADAASQLSRVYSGSGRVLKQFGITMQTGGDVTANADAAIEKLSQRLSGQADASVDNFSGRISALTTKVGDSVEEFGAHYGPAITSVGTVMLVAGGILETGLLPKLGRAVTFWRDHTTAVEESTTATEADATAVETNATATEADTIATEMNTTAVEQRAAAQQTALLTVEELTVSDEALQMDLFAETGALEAATAATEANTAAREANATAAGEQAAGADTAGAASAGAGVEDVAAAGAAGGADAAAAAGGITAAGAAAAIALPVVTLAGLAFWQLGDSAKSGAVGTDELTTALEENNGAVGDSAREVAFKALSDADAYKQARALGISVNDVTDAALGNADAMNRVKSATSDTENRYKQFANAADAAHVSVNDLSPGLMQQNNQAKALSKTLSTSNDNLQKAIQETRDHAEVTQGDASAVEGSAAAAAALQSEISGLADTYGASTSQITKWAGQLGISDAAIKAGTVSASDLSSAVNLARDAEDGATVSQDALIKATDTYRASAQGAADKAALIGATLRASQGDALSYGAAIAADKTASDALVQSWDSAQRSSVDWKTGMIDLSTAGAGPLISSLQKMQDAATQAASATYQHELATQGSKQAADDAAAVFRGATFDALVKDAGQLGITADQANALATQYFAMPESVTTSVEAEGLQAATDTAHDLEVILADMNGRHYVTYTDYEIGENAGLLAPFEAQRAAAFNSGRAVGGDLQPGVTPVGEFGKETVTWDGPGSTPHVSSNAQARSSAMAAGGGDVIYHVTVQGSVTTLNDLASDLEAIHDRRNRNNGRAPVFGGARG